MFVSIQSTSYNEFESQFGLEFFLYEIDNQNYREYRVARSTVYLNEAATGHLSAKRGVKSIMVGRHRPIEQRQPERRRRCVCTSVCVRACMRACVMCLQYTIIIFDPG